MCALFALAFSSDVERVAARLEKPTAGGHGGALSHAMRRCRDLVWDLYRRLSLLAPLATSVFSCVWGSPDSLGHDSSPSHDPAIPSRCYTLLTTPAPPQACRSTPPYHAVRRHLSPGGPLLDLATETLTSQAHAFFLPSSRRPLPPPLSWHMDGGCRLAGFFATRCTRGYRLPTCGSCKSCLYVCA